MNPTLSENWGTLRKTASEERGLEEIRKSNRLGERDSLRFSCSCHLGRSEISELSGLRVGGEKIFLSPAKDSRS